MDWVRMINQAITYMEEHLADSWTELKNPRVYYDFFKRHADEFEGN